MAIDHKVIQTFSFHRKLHMLHLFTGNFIGSVTLIVKKNSITFIGDIEWNIFICNLTGSSAVFIPHLHNLTIFHKWGKSLTQPTRGLDVGAIEYIHSQLVAQRDEGKAVLLVSLELEEVMSLSDRILVLYEGEIVGEFDPKEITVQELGLYMAGAKRMGKEGEQA